MERIPIGNTYYYENFITIDEQVILNEWALNNKFNLIPNFHGKHRRFGKLNSLQKIPNLVGELKNKVIEIENIKNPIEAPQNGHWLGIQGDTAFVEPHYDFNGLDKNFYCRRYNILISMPEEGGQPIYDDVILNLNERCMWRCDAGLVLHSSVPNVGNKHRINLSFGFLMPIDSILKTNKNFI